MTDEAKTVQMVPSYRVSTDPRGEPLWWQPNDVIPDTHTAIRPATLEEAKMMDRIMAHDRARRMPPLSLGVAVAAMMRATNAAIAKATTP